MAALDQKYDSLEELASLAADRTASYVLAGLPLFHLWHLQGEIGYVGSGLRRTPLEVCLSIPSHMAF